MKRIYNKTVKELIREFIDVYKISEDSDLLGLRHDLKNGGYFTRKEILSWFQQNYPQIKKGTINAHLILLSMNASSRRHYNVHSNGEDDLLFQENSSNFRLYQKGVDPVPIYKDSNENSENDSESPEIDFNEENNQEFAYEKDLQNFLSKNLELIEPGLSLFVDGDINGIEYPVGGRYIDLLALDKNGNYVVIELKVSKGYDRVIGQLLRYMAWIEQNQAEKDQIVRGMIICKKVSGDLKLACSKIQDVSLFEYELSISLRPIQ